MPSSSRKSFSIDRATSSMDDAAHSDSGELISAETHFVQDVELLDRRSPNWDRKARISNAVRRLRGDMPPDTVETLFGKDILASAELRLATTWPEEGFAI